MDNINGCFQEKIKDPSTFESLPIDILLYIFKYVNRTMLGRLAQVCTRFRDVVNCEILWVKPSQNSLVTNQISEEIIYRSAINLTFKERCRISQNWKKKLYKEKIFFYQKIKYMPWITLNYNTLLLSIGDTILEFERKKDGNIKTKPFSSFSPVTNGNDICRFVRKDGYIFAGYSGGHISLWTESNRKSILYQVGHNSDVNAVDMHGQYLVTGSKDKCSKIWRLNEEMKCENCHVIKMKDLVWSLSLNPSGEYIALGTSGHFEAPLALYDFAGNSVINSWNCSFDPGAGILDIHWETNYTFLTTGYDSFVRLWDLRTGNIEYYWEDPHNTTLYCLASDNLYTIMSGSSHYGRVLLWDRRYKPLIQMFYANMKHSSPVYSLSFDACQLYAALDQSLHMFDFSL